jgi:cyclic beta-1,2-glucan synthetase
VQSLQDVVRHAIELRTVGWNFHLLMRRVATQVPSRNEPPLIASLLSRATDGAAHPAVGPIRGELLGPQQLAERAREVASGERLAPGRKTLPRARLLARLEETRRILEAANDRLAAVSENIDVGPAGEWLLDNFHVVREHIREVRDGLPKGYYRELPELLNGQLAGYPRVYELAITLISHTEGRVDIGNVDLFTGAFQDVARLSIGELWAIPAMLRLGLIESVRRMTLRTVQRLDEIERADRWAARIQSANEAGGSALGEALGAFVSAPHKLTPEFVARFLYQLRLGSGALPALVWLEQWIHEEGIAPDDAAARSGERLALTQLMMANSITSLRAIGRMDWRAFVERQSSMDAILRGDPSGYYARMDFLTRDRYRHVVERIAKRTAVPEEDVARKAVALAGERLSPRGGERADPQHDESPDDPRFAHVGYYLIGRGLSELELATGYRPTFGERFHRWILRHPNTLFVGGIISGTVIALIAVFWLAGPESYSAWLAVLLLSLIPANDIAVSVMSRIVTTLMPPRTLPKLDLTDGGVPEEFRTVVVVPTLFGSVDAVRDALENLEVQFLANREAHIHFAVLGDFTDSPTEHREDDGAIVDAAIRGVETLNARYASGLEEPFYLFHRPRLWNEREGTWMGWERKRGKLAQFNRFLEGVRDGAFSVITGDADKLRGARYVITLDADTMLPPDSAPALVGAIAHPLNQAWYDEKLGRVTRGYGILQPRVGVWLPSAHRSRFAAIHSGHPGVDPYTTAVSDVYQDLYGEGSFTGKGIYDVAAFERATKGRFPENTLLSHDLIEGSYARAGLATDITVFDEYPARYLTFTRRKHRWIRGDWQLLQWLTPRVPGPEGMEPNRLSLLSRWKIFDNLRRSTVEIAMLAFLIAGWTFLPGSPLRWTVLGVLAIATPWIVSLLLAVLRPPLDKSWRAYYAAVGEDVFTSVEQVALALTFLPHQASISADAIVRTLHRLLVSKRSLLEWQSASQSERQMPTSASYVWRRMWPAVAIALAAAVLVLLLHAPGPRADAGNASREWLLTIAVLPLIGLWLVSPAIAHALGAPAVRRVPRLRAASRADALRLARLHWSYFDHFATAETNWLAPDNFQDDPAPVVAMRTSPTNVGLQLLAIVSARDCDFIQADDMVRRLELVFDSLGRMARLNGHFYNWYDVRDLHVLEPAYISTVDSGNLAGHLIALRQACLQIAGSLKDEELASRLRAIAERAYRFALDMRFAFLYDESRKLFAVGYQVATHTLDESYYDLLASEARLASFVAIAKNDIPVAHWFHLGRALTRASGETALVSWSGSMFEYLMPALVMQSFPFTLLGETYRSVVRRQMAYGYERSVPWGVSESAYNLRDRHLTYQYRAFGVPDLALKRGLGRDLVVAPYATSLAAMIAPRQALENFARLEERGALGEYGFRDSLDYTRPQPGQKYAVVKNYMAHHAGMSFVALANTLTERIWRRRFHADPLVRSAEFLLHERMPRRLVLEEPQEASPEEALPRAEMEHPAVREIISPNTARPEVALLGHLPYTIMLTNGGSGYSRYEDLAVTRWRADGTRDDTGTFVYIRDVTAGRVWSAAHQPTCATADWYRAVLASDRVTFQREDGDIETRTEVAVVPEDAAEVRRVTVTNNSREQRELELTSYGEIVLAAPDADRAHPAFANLFVETEWHEWCTAISATRRPRSSVEKKLWCVHVVDSGTEGVGPVSCETDRARFIGRGRSTANPAALEQEGPLSGTTGAVLDPVFALRVRIELAPGASASVAFTTLVAPSAERAFELADRYHDSHNAQRALDLAWTGTQIELRELNITPADAAVFQDIAGRLFYGESSMRAPEDELLRNRGAQQRLWSIGVSGDWPILIATIDSADGLPTLRQLFAAHRYWRRRGMMVDLVILNAHAASYMQELHAKIMAAMFGSSDSGAIDQPGGVFIRRLDLLDPADLLMLRATARVHVTCDGRSLGRILKAKASSAGLETDESESATLEPRAPVRSTPPSSSVVRRLQRGAAHLVSATTSSPRAARNEPVTRTPDAAPPTPHSDLAFDNGIGGLAADGDYQVYVDGYDRLPPAPWANVVANENGGFITTERGTGFSWAGNSYFYRLTPWHNDPVSDPSSDAIYLRDEESSELWSATPAPVDHLASFTVRHGAGRSSFEHEYSGIEARLDLGVPPAEAVKLSLLRVTNRSDRPRRISVTPYVEWTLGVLREHTQHQVHTAYDPERNAIFAWNNFDESFTDWVAFLTMSEQPGSHTANRREFLGRNGSTRDPAAMHAPALGNRVGAGIDPCGALRCELSLEPGETREVAIALGAARGQEEANRLADEYRDISRARAAMGHTVDDWTGRLSTVRVRTPDPAFDAMVNRWALYQALSCRMWARSALYQSSGAYGFRDQLQDVLAFLYAEPAIARQHILRSAARQFLEGDVQHWWHPHSGRGVRTRFSDDLAWLPFVVDRYVRVTGDATVLDESVTFLEMRSLEPGEQEVYDLPRVTEERATVYEHCMRALRKACTSGPHDLPLMGCGDWNDGMNRVGIGGRGESVWLGWFLITTSRAFAEHAEARGDAAAAAELRAHADGYVTALERDGWDGEWYRRAYFDDGTPLGSSTSEECRIDSIAQSWSIISAAGDPARRSRALHSLEEHLVREDARLIMLLTPPFDHSTHDPGYIKGYVPGVRENGAQYTHAALWAVLATALQGNGDRAFELFQMLNPLTHARSEEGLNTYKVEPYAVAADVYTAAGHLGRGGWTWYTGSAAWTYRVALESILGFDKRGATLRIEPRVPSDWPDFTIDYRYGSSTYTITVHQPGRVRADSALVQLDGSEVEGGVIQLEADGGRHEVHIHPR